MPGWKQMSDVSEWEKGNAFQNTLWLALAGAVGELDVMDKALGTCDTVCIATVLVGQKK